MKPFYTKMPINMISLLRHLGYIIRLGSMGVPTLIGGIIITDLEKIKKNTQIKIIPSGSKLNPEIHILPYKGEVKTIKPITALKKIDDHVHMCSSRFESIVKLIKSSEKRRKQNGR